MAAESRRPRDGGIGDYATYEDYLDDQIGPKDMKYLQNEELARQLVELGYRGSTETLKRDEFELRKRKQEESIHNTTHQVTRILCSAGVDVVDAPLLHELAKREAMVINGKLTSIIFIRDKNHKGQEISGYIDYAHRLKTEDFAPYFRKQKRLLPRPSDLSFYNWDTQTSTSNPTPNFQVIADHERGLLFKNKRDRKVINVDPEAQHGDNSSRHEIKTKNYMQAVIYDHMTRRKT